MTPGFARRLVVALVAGLVLITTGVGWNAYRDVFSGLTHSSALAGGLTSANGDQNILIMGLDSRLDEKGHPLPADMYNALHAGDENNGGYNANVLILLHVPSDGSKATAISIPRDDYVDLVGCPDDQCKGKIKQAYGLAVDQAKNQPGMKGVADPESVEQKAREAGRKAEIATVRKFLGDVPIDHFVEVTLAAFFQIARVVQPIQVCLNEDTSDSYSGANFHKGTQEINASQAMAFVRQRRDPNTNLDFTDLDRDRRQQAFIVSLSQQLQHSGALTDPGRMQGLLDVAKQDIAVDSGLDLMSFARSSSNLTGGKVTFFTLPVDHFGQNGDGEDVNVVDLPTIHSIVGQLLGVPSGAGATTSAGSSAAQTATLAPTPTPTPSTVATGGGASLDVVNSSGRTGLAAQLEAELSTLGFTRGSASTGGTIRSSSSIEYGPDAAQPARQLAVLLGGMPTKVNPGLPDKSVRLNIGTDFSTPASLIDSSSGSSSTNGMQSTTAPTSRAPVTPVPATGVGVNAPEPTNLTSLSGDGIPCVK